MHFGTHAIGDWVGSHFLIAVDILESELVQLWLESSVYCSSMWGHSEERNSGEGAVPFSPPWAQRHPGPLLLMVP